MINYGKVLNFCYDKLQPQLQRNNFNIILHFRIGNYWYVGRLLQIHELSYTMDLDMGDNKIQQFLITRLNELEIAGNANGKLFKWKDNFSEEKLKQLTMEVKKNGRKQ